jgi:hypothetical protein
MKAALVRISTVAGFALLLAACEETTRRPVTSTTTLTSATAAVCHGRAFDADDADPACLHHGVGALTPPPSALKVSLVTPPTVRAGYDAGLVVEMQNVSSAPLTLDVDDSCGTFEGIASNDKTTSFESDCIGMCANASEPHVLRVTLDPGGVVRKKVKFVAVETRIMTDDHGTCGRHTTGALPPGSYDLRVTLPWTDQVEEDPSVSRPRVLESKLTISAP